MGVAPEAIVDFFSSIGSKVLLSSLSSYAMTCNNSLRYFSFFFFSSGARPALPIGVDPEAMVGFFGGDHRLKKFFDLYFFDLTCMYILVHTRSMTSLI
jgi:hypothetical protein